MTMRGRQRRKCRLSSRSARSGKLVMVRFAMWIRFWRKRQPDSAMAGDDGGLLLRARDGVAAQKEPA